MFDRELIEEKLSQITKYLSKLEPLANLPKLKFTDSDLHYQAERFVELIVGSAIDINFHIIKELNLDAPIKYKESFKVIADAKILDHDLGYQIADSAGLRNIIVHHYDEIDLDRFYDGLAGGIKDYQEYIKEINLYLKNNKGGK